ncbi:MAG: histidine kinase dimerization/phospho-acceptor domain-containing protein [Alphaproteobacteria bacterium]|nr:histidine kinase dimerization/phospho-acceptor domain-containing protein [Alphaproteobacteria bacterium]
MKKLSLQLRLILSFLVISLGVGLCAGLMSWYETKEEMDEFFDTYQLNLARQLASADWNNINHKTQKKTNELIEALDDDGEEEEEAIAFAVFTKQGKMIFNDGEEGKHFVFSPTSGFANQQIGHKKKNKWRMIWLESIDGKFYVAVGQELDFRQEASLEMVLQSLVPWSVGLLFLITFTLFLVRKELLPLKKMAKTLSNRRGDDFSEIDTDALPSEILPIVDEMNDLLERIESMVKKERSFISDAAHELRTPLAALKVQLDVLELSKEDEKSFNKASQNLHQGIERSAHLVEQLLALSRLETNHPSKIALKQIDWRKISHEILTFYQPKILQKGLRFELQLSDASPIEQGNEILCVLMLRNLLANAILYSPEKSEIKLKITQRAITLENLCALTSKDFARLGERFFRPSGQKEMGSGLGLSIVKKIAEIHTCVVNFTLEKGLFLVEVERNNDKNFKNLP